MRRFFGIYPAKALLLAPDDVFYPGYSVQIVLFGLIFEFYVGQTFGGRRAK